MDRRIGWHLLLALGIGLFALIGVADELAPEPALKDLAGAGLGAAAQSDAGEIFAKHCAMCHGKEGKGDGPAAAAMDPSPTDLTDAEKMGALSDEDILAVLSNGKGSMPGYASTLEAEELEALAKYVRSMSADAAGDE